jgi:retinol dehydrogenase 13
VDILINNAGVTFHPFSKTPDGFETHLQVNYLGHFLLTHLLMPMIKKSKQGRIINVSAHAHSAGRMCIDDPLGITNLAPEYHPRDAFAHSKLAINLWSRKLAKLLSSSTAITVNCLTPGLVRGTKHMRHSTIMRALSAKLIMFPCMYVFMKTPILGAQTAIFLATDDKVRSTSGEYFK